jgi:hypothetical protein
VLQRQDDRDGLPRGEGDLDPVRAKEILTPAAVRHPEPMRLIRHGEQLRRRARQAGRGQSKMETMLREETA